MGKEFKALNKQPPIGVILAQIGTPTAPTAKAVRPYLKRFYPTAES